jgi:hypothetical protein
MGQIPVATAARVLGLSERGLRRMMSMGRVRDASRAGEPASVREDDVTRLLHERRAEASQRQPDALAFAQQVRRSVWPDETLDMVVLTDGRQQPADAYQAAHVIKQPAGRNALARLNEDAVALFGRAAVETAAMPRDTWKMSCRWCWADASAKALGGLRPTDSPAYVALLGAEPCPQDRARWAEEQREYRAAMQRLRVTQTDRQQRAERERARQAFAAATNALSAASRRQTEALRTLASVDPSAAVVAASGAPGGRGRGSMPCGCTYATYCPTHAAVFGTTDRSISRR